MKAFKILLIIIFVSIHGCKPKEVVVTQTLSDTLIVHKTEALQLPTISKLIINEPCDSTGILNDFKQSYVTENVKIDISSVDGNIVAEINIDSIKQTAVKEYRKGVKETVIEIEVDKPVPYIPRFVWISLGANILLILYVFRRFLPFLKFIP